MKINAEDMHFQVLNNQLRATSDQKITIENCMGQRYIFSGMSKKRSALIWMALPLP
jgi:hypothetical protein